MAQKHGKTLFTIFASNLILKKMTTFRKTKITPKAELPKIKAQDQLLLSSDKNVSTNERKSRKSKEKGVERGVIPQSKSLPVLPFLVIVECYRLFKNDLKNNGAAYSVLNYDLFMLIVFVASAGKSGITCTGLMNIVYTCNSATGVRNLSKKLFALCSYGYVNLSSNRYYLSGRSRSLFLSKVGLKSFLELDSIVKSFVKE